MAFGRVTRVCRLRAKIELSVIWVQNTLKISESSLVHERMVNLGRKKALSRVTEFKNVLVRQQCTRGRVASGQGGTPSACLQQAEVTHLHGQPYEATQLEGVELQYSPSPRRGWDGGTSRIEGRNPRLSGEKPTFVLVARYSLLKANSLEFCRLVGSARLSPSPAPPFSVLVFSTHATVVSWLSSILLTKQAFSAWASVYNVHVSTRQRLVEQHKTLHTQRDTHAFDCTHQIEHHAPARGAITDATSAFVFSYDPGIS